MTAADIEFLKRNDGKQVEMRCTDGEVLSVRVRFVSESEGDVICDLVSSTGPTSCSAPGFAYSVAFKDIESVRAPFSKPDGSKTRELDSSCRAMAADHERESEALKWSEATIGDIPADD